MTLNLRRLVIATLGAALGLLVACAAPSTGAAAAAAAAAATDATISGTIFNPAGAPLAGATVELAGGDAEPVTTGANGTYTITDVPTGASYIVEALPPSGTYAAATYYGNVDDAYQAEPVAVGSTSPTGIDIQLNPGGAISGTVTTAGGTAIAGVDVELEGADGTDIADAVTDVNGDYSLPALAPGTYYVDFDTAGDQTTGAEDYVSQFYGAPGGGLAGEEATNAAPVSVSADATTQASQSLTLGGEITGTVTDAGTGAALDEGDVVARDYAGDYSQTATPDANGTYTLYGVPAGQIYLDFEDCANASGIDDDEVNAWYTATGPAESLPTSTAVAVADGATTTAGIALPTPGAISGTVTANGQPASDVLVDVFDPSGNLVEGASTGSDGYYQLAQLLPGTYKVEFAPNGGAGSLGFTFYGGATTLSAAATVTVGAGANTASIDASLSSGGAITGTVDSAASGQPIGDVEVELEDAAGDVLERAVTADDGTYELGGVGAGSYDVEFVPPVDLAAVYQSQYYGGTQLLSGSTPVSVTAGQTTTGVDAALSAGVTNLIVPVVAGTTPKIAGTARVGSRLKAEVTGWTSGSLYAYQWYAGGVAVRNATASTLRLTDADYKQAISVHVTGRLSGYIWTTEASVQTRAVAKGALRTVVPKIVGPPRVGAKLAANPGAWTAGTRFSYRWYASGKPIPGARRSTLTLSAAEAGRRITVKVTGTLKDYAAASRTSRRSRRVGR